MTIAPTLSAASELICQIPDYETEIADLVKLSNKDLLYTKFLKRFFAYIPVDYNAKNKLSLFEEFASKSFAFFKSNNSIHKKIEISKISSDNAPSIDLLILNQNKPLILDSLNCLLSILGLKAKYIFHPIILAKRDNLGNLEDISIDSEKSIAESLIFVKILGNFDQKAIDSIEAKIEQIMDQNDLAYSAKDQVFSKIAELAHSISQYSKNTNQSLVKESTNFLRWISVDNFTSLGMFDLNVEDQTIISEVGAKAIWRNDEQETKNIIDFAMNPYQIDKIIILGKINYPSPINLNSLIDYIIIKHAEESNKHKTITVVFGLYKLDVYYRSAKEIPILRNKIQFVLENAKFPIDSYNAQKLQTIAESLPKEAIIQIEQEDLFCMCIHILSSLLSKRLKLFIQPYSSESYINILLFLPRERLTYETHSAISKYLTAKLNAKILSDHTTEVAPHFSYLFLTLEIKEKVDYSTSQIEQDLDQLSVLWMESLYQKLINQFDEYKAGIEFSTYSHIFLEDYRHKFNTDDAIIDLNNIKIACANSKVIFNLTRLSAEEFELKIYNSKKKLALSNILPFIENLGFKAIDEQTFHITPAGDIEESWIYQFTLSAPSVIAINDQTLKKNVEDILDKMLVGLLASDSLSKLVVLCGFDWREIKLLKALTRYLHQTAFVYGKGYVQLTLIKHYKYTKLLNDLFKALFDPNIEHQKNIKDKNQQLISYLNDVSASAEDKVLRQMSYLVNAITRTNFYQLNNQNLPKDYISFKLNPAKIPDLPRPVPFAEIFVFSNYFEGIHLRGGKVARGGIRWSDRGEDYRTEILGLMKAQMSKNAVIVPVGCKGGFFPLFTQDSYDNKNQYISKIIECYQDFLRGLLDITDNIIENNVVHPADTVIYDDNDPYLVAAADKGTATFSDYANNVSAEYNFWLQDAFASGGSAGYDHKKMGITAKGAWISVQRHFQEIGIDVQQDCIKVIGIGDMSGDVCGNGLLRSETIKLVAAFNHMHIFIDPDPDPRLSFQERLRLFNLPGSKWTDYDLKLISQGGGIFERSAKTIFINEQMKDLLSVNVDELSPEDLIKAILKSKVDLLWNGGIGTYIKASFETHLDIGDKANDYLRCDAKDIQAKVIAEGGNLGVSQLGRIEYDQHKGRINTDFIDNSAGVDCSDHEVNIKIALNNAIKNRNLSLVERNNILVSMASEVEALVLQDNYDQTQAISIAEISSDLAIESFAQLITLLEKKKLLNREVEFLPSKNELSKRAAAKEGMPRPELAILLSYSKMYAYNELIDTELFKDQYFEQFLIKYFPQVMRNRFEAEIKTHPLRQEIIATTVINNLVNKLGGATINTIKDSTGSALEDIVRSYVVVSEIFDIDQLWHLVDSVTTNLDSKIKIEMFAEISKIIRRGISWFIRNFDYPINMQKAILEFKDKSQYLNKIMPNLLVGEAKDKFDNRFSKYSAAGMDSSIANSISSLDSMISAFDIIYITNYTKTKAYDTVAKAYFSAGEEFSLDWLRRACDKQMSNVYWNRLSTQSLKDDFYDKQRRLLISVISSNNLEFIDWLKENIELANIFTDFIKNIKGQENVNLDMIILANKKLEIFLRKLE
ncbi:MAG: glutamate dehydrogenase [Rickettsiaceae bacterium]|nr:MAG: glutamate dehydrogenase [Rickettsiaceae bacterium]